MSKSVNIYGGASKNNEEVAGGLEYSGGDTAFLADEPQLRNQNTHKLKKQCFQSARAH